MSNPPVSPTESACRIGLRFIHCSNSTRPQKRRKERPCVFLVPLFIARRAQCQAQNANNAPGSRHRKCSMQHQVLSCGLTGAAQGWSTDACLMPAYEKVRTQSGVGHKYLWNNLALLSYSSGNSCFSWFMNICINRLEIKKSWSLPIDDSRSVAHRPP